MEPAAPLSVNWRDANAYAALVEAERSFFAWEWLRRDPAYRSAAQRHSCSGDGGPRPEPFGLVSFEPLDTPVPDARPMWSEQTYPQVLIAEVAGKSAGDCALELHHISHYAHLLRGPTTDHLLLTDGVRAIRVDGPSGAFAGKPLCLRFPLERLIAGELPLLHLRRLVALVRTGRFLRSLHPAEPRARRWILQLRTHDAIVAGAGLREIAEELLGRSSTGPGWRTRDPSLRSQAQRLVRSARALANGGFREFLCLSDRFDHQCRIGCGHTSGRGGCPQEVHDLGGRAPERHCATAGIRRDDEPCHFPSRPRKGQGSNGGRTPGTC